MSNWLHWGRPGSDTKRYWNPPMVLMCKGRPWCAFTAPSSWLQASLHRILWIHEAAPLLFANLLLPICKTNCFSFLPAAADSCSETVSRRALQLCEIIVGTSSSGIQQALLQKVLLAQVPRNCCQLWYFPPAASRNASLTDSLPASLRMPHESSWNYISLKSLYEWNLEKKKEIPFVPLLVCNLC